MSSGLVGALHVDVDVQVSDGQPPLTLRYTSPVVYKIGLVATPNTQLVTDTLVNVMLPLLDTHTLTANTVPGAALVGGQVAVR